MIEPLGIVLIVVVGALIGFFGDALFPGEVLFSWLGAIVACIVGAFVGSLAVQLGPTVFGIYVVPALIGGVLFGVVYELVISLVTRRGG